MGNRNPALIAAPCATRRVLTQEIAESIDVRRKIEGVLSGEPFRQLGVAMLQRFDDFQVIDD
jgi:hypothetical protein